MPTIIQLRGSKSSLAMMFLFLLICFNVGCFIYYKRAEVKGEQLTELPKNKTYHIYLLNETSPDTGLMWELSNTAISKTAMNGNLHKLRPETAKQVAVVNGARDARKSRYDILLYLNNLQTLPDTGAYTLNYADVQKIEVYEINWGKSILISSLITLGSAALILGIIWVIILLTKDSCPFIYTESLGGEVHFEGEIYSGATYPNLERHDYLPLQHLQPINNQYRLHITNEVKEEQHTNLLELYAIDHSPDCSVLPDKYGQIHTLRNLHAPIVATNLQGENIQNYITCSDNNYYTPEVLATSNPNEGMILTFVKPPQAKTGKLVINARNSFWLDNLYGQFLDEFGALYPRFEAMSNTKTREEMQQWMLKQQLPLSVSIETPDGWKPADYFNLIGPMAFKKDVLPINLTSVKTDTFRVKLNYGFMFWDIDEVAMDFSDNQPAALTVMPLQTATDQFGCNVVAALQQDDTLYYHQPFVGDEAMLTFACPPLLQGKQRSLILHSKGYYHILRQPGNHVPNLAYLQSFRQPNALPKFSVQQLSSFMQQVQNITLQEQQETNTDCEPQNIQP